MNARDIIKTVMKSKDVTNAELARRLDITPATVWDRLNNTKGRKDIPLSLLSSMLGAVGYKVLIVPEDTEVPKGGFEVEQVE